jgi:hypothetical protein
VNTVFWSKSSAEARWTIPPSNPRPTKSITLFSFDSFSIVSF